MSLNRDQMENVVDLKAVEAAIVKKFDELGAVNAKAQAEIAELGKANSETLSKLDSISKEYNELYERVQRVEQKGQFLAENRAGYDVGAEVLKSEQFESFRNGRQGSARIELKTAIINTNPASTSQPLVQGDRLSGIFTTPNRVLTLRDILPASTTDSNLIEYTRENAFTNNAGPQISGSPQQFENVTKPESAITFTLVTSPVITLAHWIPASRQVLDDSASLMSHINNRLMYGLKLKEEAQLLAGTGSNHQLNGLNTGATAYTVLSPTLTNELDIIRSAIKQAHVAEYRPDFLVLNPSDWYDIEIKKVGSSDLRYVVGDPINMMAPRIWGLDGIVTNSQTSGKFLLGSRNACEIKDRQQAAVEISRENDTNFVKNMVTILAEERIGFIIYRTEAFIYGSL